ncbi:MAG: DUF5916 domain-containing protein [Bacteroidota bacterium]
MKSVFTFILVFNFLAFGIAQNSKKSISAEKISESITIDGVLDEAAWKNAIKATDFVVFEPINASKPKSQTEVSVLYNDNSIFIGAVLYDSAPDSILRELGERDDELINADMFAVALYPFNDGQNDFRFKVSASGVQFDIKNTSTSYDIQWDAVWKSKTRITKDGWIVEIEIPYSAIRFPDSENQTWGINFWRNNRRYRELSSWNYVNNKTDNEGIQVGELININNIKAPLRLSFTPYLAAYAENSKLKNGSSNHYFGNGGMDLKYGINESFTLDMTLIPDFGQVESDNTVLNLSPFEVKYDENRSFFTEGTDLFSKADLFYSRRIGATPQNYYNVEANLDSTETIKTNPSETSLINATKFSGRTNNGLGIGFFNAITAESKAIITSSEGLKREYTTQPLSNYNIIVADQTFGENSYASIINTNVLFEGNGTQSNITATDFKLSDDKNKFMFKGLAALSKTINTESKYNTGVKNYFEAGKTSGNFRFSLSNTIITDQYNQNYMGYIRETDVNAQSLVLQYKVFKPFGSFLNLNSSVFANRMEQYSSRHFGSFDCGGNLWATLANYLTVGTNFTISPVENYDFYEARTAGQLFKLPPSYFFTLWISPDYRKKLAVDFDFGYFEHIDKRYKNSLWYTVSPRVRINDKIFFVYTFLNDFEWNNVGFAESTDKIIFGSRNIKHFENQITGKYAINANTGFSLKFRHYWSEVEYNKLYDLKTDGSLLNNHDSNLNASEYNTNFNAFNIDLVFKWRFAPGSELNIVWKNNIITEGNAVNITYIDNLTNTIESPQVNSLSVKFLYYIDYQRIKGRNKK